MAGGIGAAWTNLKRLILPTRCVACSQISADTVCAQCLACCERVGEVYCVRCGRRRQTSWASPDCAECHDVQIGVSRTRSCLVYTGLGRDLLGEYKFRRRAGVGERLIQTLVAWLPGSWKQFYGLPDASPDIVIPVPLHPRRLKQRRFNQSLLLARLVAQSRGLECVSEALVRERETLSQVGLTAPQRWKNVLGAFEVPEPKRETIAGRSVLLVDDLMTTGATLAACARALKRGGAAEVLGLTLFSTVHGLPEPDGH